MLRVGIYFGGVGLGFLVCYRLQHEADLARKGVCVFHFFSSCLLDGDSGETYWTGQWYGTGTAREGCETPRDFLILFGYLDGVWVGGTYLLVWFGSVWLWFGTALHCVAFGGVFGLGQVDMVERKRRRESLCHGGILKRGWAGVPWRLGPGQQHVFGTGDIDTDIGGTGRQGTWLGARIEAVVWFAQCVRIDNVNLYCVGIKVVRRFWWCDGSFWVVFWAGDTRNTDRFQLVFSCPLSGL